MSLPSSSWILQQTRNVKTGTTIRCGYIPSLVAVAFDAFRLFGDARESSNCSFSLSSDGVEAGCFRFLAFVEGPSLSESSMALSSATFGRFLEERDL